MKEYIKLKCKRCKTEFIIINDGTDTKIKEKVNNCNCPICKDKKIESIGEYDYLNECFKNIKKKCKMIE